VKRFRNLRLYRLHGTVDMDTQSLAEALQQHVARPPGNQEAVRKGWCSPSGKPDSLLLHEVQGQRLLTMQRDVRLLPEAVLKDEVEKRVANLEQERGGWVGRIEKMNIKEQVYEELLPKAFIRTHKIDVWWDTTRGLIAVFAESRARAEEALDLLRETLGSLKVTPLATQTPPMRAMTHWMSNPDSRPENLLLGDKAVLKSYGDDDVVRGQHVDLDSDDMQQLIATGRQVSQLALEIDTVMSFVLHDDLSIRGIQFSYDLLHEALETEDDGDAIVRLDADFAIMAKAVGESIESLLEWLGGEAKATHRLLKPVTQATNFIPLA